MRPARKRSPALSGLQWTSYQGETHFGTGARGNLQCASYHKLPSYITHEISDKRETQSFTNVFLEWLRRAISRIQNLNDHHAILFLSAYRNGSLGHTFHSMLDCIRYHLIEYQRQDRDCARRNNDGTRFDFKRDVRLWRAQICVRNSNNFTGDIIDSRFAGILV